MNIVGSCFEAAADLADATGIAGGEVISPFKGSSSSSL